MNKNKENEGKGTSINHTFPCTENDNEIKYIHEDGYTGEFHFGHPSGIGGWTIIGKKDLFDCLSKLGFQIRNKIILKFKKNVIGAHNVKFAKDSKKEYIPWYYNWQGMNEHERVEKGIFVECHGHGEFDVFRVPIVEVINQ